MAANFATYTADGGDSRLSRDAGRPDTYIAPQQRLLHDPAVTFEEYHYYALKTRAEEEEALKNDTSTTTLLQIIFPPKSTPPGLHDSGSSSPPFEGTSEEKTHGSRERKSSVNANLANQATRAVITDKE